MRIMKSILGYMAATLSLLIMLVSVLSFTAFPDTSKWFVAATGLVTSPNYSGGEVVKTIKHGAYQTEIHRPIFDALIGETKEGFIQVGWRPANALPPRIDEEIDFDADGQADFRVAIDTASHQATLTPASPNVLSLQGVYRIGESLAIRVKLRNPKK